MNEASIFLLEKSKGKYEFDFPEAIYVDTCFWNEAYGKSSNKQGKQECVDFLAECAGHGTVLYVSGIIYDEIQHVFKRTLIDMAVKEHSISVPKYANGVNDYKKLFDIVKQRVPNIKNKIDADISGKTKWNKIN